MNFDFSEDQKLLQKTARDFLVEHCPLEAVRKVLESSSSYDPALWKGTAEMGWQGAAIPEAYGGAGFGYLELAVLAEEVGRALAPLPFASSVYLATEAILLAGSEEQKSALLPSLASGDRIGSFALFEKPGTPTPDAVETRFEDGTVSGTKIPVVDGDVADLVVVVARDGDGLSLVLVDLDAKGVERTRLESFDGSRSQARIRFDRAPATVLGKAGEGASLAQRVLDRAAILMAFEQLGGAQRSFDETKAFAMGRYAFGRPIASFQSLKHRMADLFCKVELARSNCYYGAWALSHDARELPLAACQARVAATEAFELAATENIQIHGGVGFTWEYDCHLFYRRSKHLALALGNANSWRERLIQELESGSAA
ncbi:MAG: acyl-CoA/acyl-ACP dehydrogenase [Deltaproteobacteria bacterium]|nr:MAG: acyl-CoA/acyl-ACP dehydrogenase [Deltaproteobacteria bacterium]